MRLSHPEHSPGTVLEIKCGRARGRISRSDKRALTFASKLNRNLSVSHHKAAPLFGASGKVLKPHRLSAALNDNGAKGRGQLETLS